MTDYAPAVKAPNRTYAARAGQRPQPAPTYTLDELRERRRKGLPVTLDASYVLHEDVAAIVGPLAQQVSAAPWSMRFLRSQVASGASHLTGPRVAPASIDDLALAVHGVVHAVVGLLAEADAEHKTRHLSGDQRARARASLRTLVERPALPEFDRGAAHSGEWAAPLVALAEPYSAPLRKLLGANTTGVVSNRLLRELRDLDAAAAALQRRLTRDAVLRAESPPPLQATAADLARRELESLGVQL